MIEKLWIDSFKAFSDAPKHSTPGIPLQPFTVLVGPNGSGKSTILQAVDMLGWLSSGNIDRMLSAQHWEYADLPHLRSDRKQISIGAHVSLPEVSAEVS